MGNCLLKTRLGRKDPRGFENMRLKGRSFPARVLEVYDGDTITVGFRCNGGFWKSPFRIYGVDAPEMKPRRGGRSIESVESEKAAAVRSRDFLRRLIHNQIVQVDICGKFTDKYGRLMGAIFFRTENVAEKMVKAGHARRYYGDKKVSFDRDEKKEEEAVFTDAEVGPGFPVYS